MSENAEVFNLKDFWEIFGFHFSEMDKKAYQASPIRSNHADRQRLNKAETAQLEQQIYDVLAESHPQSVRHVYYAMTNP